MAAQATVVKRRRSLFGIFKIGENFTFVYSKIDCNRKNSPTAELMWLGCLRNVSLNIGSTWRSQLYANKQQERGLGKYLPFLVGSL